ncbi:hypothetical protein GCM10009837_58560 [Streptomyces durmitorensis]|uniref:Uncharacterized protein n=1 Tax=Streptomyces durmitorensis TaxID=319947 RepID=A0ABY4PSR1_9ACTN|nr:hypothetical protein [Streptomyces durmitorensis]UQT55944.1 hypothetical protein M4V62_12995 [Streptomyces durmitorensis]
MTGTHDDAFGVALSVLTPEERHRFGEITDALVEAADAAAVAPGWTVRRPADAWHALAVHYRAQRDPLWPAFSAAAARADEIGGR